MNGTLLPDLSDQECDGCLGIFSQELEVKKFVPTVHYHLFLSQPT